MTDIDLCLTCSIEQVKKWDENIVIEKINDNFGHLKDWVVLADQKEEAKTKVAELRKIHKEINDFRIKVGKEWDKPLILFKQKVDKVLSVISTPINSLDCQIKSFDEKEKLEKKELIISLWKKLGLSEYPLDSFFNQKWLNKTYKIAAIENDINAIKERIYQAQDLILSEVQDDTLSYILKKSLENNLSDPNIISRLIVEKNRFLSEQKEQKEQNKEIKIPLEDPIVDVKLHIRGRKSELLKIKNFVFSCDVEVLL